MHIKFNHIFLFIQVYLSFYYVHSVLVLLSFLLHINKIVICLYPSTHNCYFFFHILFHWLGAPIMFCHQDGYEHSLFPKYKWIGLGTPLLGLILALSFCHKVYYTLCFLWIEIVRIIWWYFESINFYTFK